MFQALFGVGIQKANEHNLTRNTTMRSFLRYTPTKGTRRTKCAPVIFLGLIAEFILQINIVRLKNIKIHPNEPWDNINVPGLIICLGLLLMPLFMHSNFFML
jgi:hypothetical protein